MSAGSDDPFDKLRETRDTAVKAYQELRASKPFADAARRTGALVWDYTPGLCCVAMMTTRSPDS